MNKEINSRGIMFDRVDRFCGQPEIVLPTGGQTLITELQTVITTLEELSGDQVSGRGERSAGVASRRQTATELRGIVRSIATSLPALTRCNTRAWRSSSRHRSATATARC